MLICNFCNDQDLPASSVGHVGQRDEEELHRDTQRHCLQVCRKLIYIQGVLYIIPDQSSHGTNVLFRFVFYLGLCKVCLTYIIGVSVSVAGLAASTVPGAACAPSSATCSPSSHSSPSYVQSSRME